ncbi:hypothetical protein D3C72_2166130 [compost metagenome]
MLAQQKGDAPRRVDDAAAAVQHHVEARHGADALAQFIQGGQQFHVQVRGGQDDGAAIARQFQFAQLDGDLVQVWLRHKAPSIRVVATLSSRGKAGTSCCTYKN